jgi:hypothetical protein
MITAASARSASTVSQTSAQSAISLVRPALLAVQLVATPVKRTPIQIPKEFVSATSGFIQIQTSQIVRLAMKLA